MLSLLCGFADGDCGEAAFFLTGFFSAFWADGLRLAACLFAVDFFLGIADGIGYVVDNCFKILCKSLTSFKRFITPL